MSLFIFPDGHREHIKTGGRPDWIVPLIEPLRSFIQAEDGPERLREHKTIHFVREKFRYGNAERIVYLPQDHTPRQKLNLIFGDPQ